MRLICFSPKQYNFTTYRRLGVGIFLFKAILCFLLRDSRCDSVVPPQMPISAFFRAYSRHCRARGQLAHTRLASDIFKYLDTTLFGDTSISWGKKSSGSTVEHAGVLSTINRGIDRSLLFSRCAINYPRFALNPVPLKVMGGVPNIRNSLPLHPASAQVDLVASSVIPRFSENVCSGFSEHLYSYVGKASLPNW
jgi:hypothetical protein